MKLLRLKLEESTQIASVNFVLVFATMLFNCDVYFAEIAPKCSIVRKTIFQGVEELIRKVGNSPQNSRNLKTF